MIDQDEAVRSAGERRRGRKKQRESKRSWASEEIGRLALRRDGRYKWGRGAGGGQVVGSW